MKNIVVDANIVIKWFLPEIHAVEATHLLQKNLQFLAPDLIFAEVGNILWKKTRSKELPMEIATEILEDFQRLPIITYENESLLTAAWSIANKYQCTVYDSLYVALARAEKCSLVTADQALVRNLSHSPLKNTIVWVEEIEKCYN